MKAPGQVQSLAWRLPNRPEMGTGTAQQIMAKLYITATFVALTFGVGSYLGVKQLDAAVKQQCLTHDWPAQADQIHKDWCVDNGYKI